MRSLPSEIWSHILFLRYRQEDILRLRGVCRLFHEILETGVMNVCLIGPVSLFFLCLYPGLGKVYRGKVQRVRDFQRCVRYPGLSPNSNRCSLASVRHLDLRLPVHKYEDESLSTAYLHFLIQWLYEDPTRTLMVHNRSLKQEHARFLFGYGHDTLVVAITESCEVPCLESVAVTAITLLVPTTSYFDVNHDCDSSLPSIAFETSQSTGKNPKVYVTDESFITQDSRILTISSIISTTTPEASVVTPKVQGYEYTPLDWKTYFSSIDPSSLCCQGILLPPSPEIELSEAKKAGSSPSWIEHEGRNEYALIGFGQD